MSAACLSKFQQFLKLSNKQHMRSFYAPTCITDCLQILYKFCKNWISVKNIVHQLKLSLRCKYCKIHSCSIFPDAINSIGPTLLGRIERLQANDVSLLWRHSSWVRSRTLERAHRRPFFDGFWEIWTPECCRSSCGPQKGLPYVTTDVLSYRASESIHEWLQ